MEGDIPKRTSESENERKMGTVLKNLLLCYWRHFLAIGFATQNGALLGGQSSTIDGWERCSAMAFETLVNKFAIGDIF